MTNGLVTNENGDKEWYLNGELHREDGPAVEGSNGYKCWYLNGELHREDGPAIEFSNGVKQWFLKNVEYSRSEFDTFFNAIQLQKKLNSELNERQFNSKKLKI